MKLPGGFYADANELKAEQLRLAGARAKTRADLKNTKQARGHLRRQIESCLDLLNNADAQYAASDEVGRKELNQAVFARLYNDDDEVVAGDFQPAFQRFVSDGLANDLKTERKRE